MHCFTLVKVLCHDRAQATLKSKVIVHGVVQTLLGEHRKELLEEYQMGVRLVLIGCIGMFVIGELTSSSWLTHLLSNKTLNETVIHHLDLGVHYQSLKLFVENASSQLASLCKCFQNAVFFQGREKDIFCGTALTIMFT